MQREKIIKQVFFFQGLLIDGFVIIERLDFKLENKS